MFIYVNHNRAKNTKKGKILKIAFIKYTPSFNNIIIQENRQILHIKIAKIYI